MGIIYGEFINEYTDISYIKESMTSKERNELKDDDFGIPELRKYPIHDKKHVEQAIKMFNHVEKKYEAELADNLLDAMERYHISTDVVGDKNRLKKYIKEETSYVTEGLIWNDNTPKDIKKLKEDIREELKTDTSLDDIISTLKDSFKDRDFSSEEKSLIYKITKKFNLKIHGYTIKTSSYGSAEISNTHEIITTFKNYILNMKFLGAKGKISLISVTINYDSDKCKIPKNVAFDFLSMLSPLVDGVRTTKHSIKISALAKAIDSGYPRVAHKYSNKYDVKKGIGGFNIKLSLLKSVKESNSLMAATLPRQGYNPNNVYLINYTNRNTFTNDLAVCKDMMSSIFICDGVKPPFNISLTEFKEIASDIKVYKCINDTSFDHIVRLSKCGLDFYKNAVNDSSVTLESLKTDYRFNIVTSFIDELKSLEECIINSAPRSGIVNEIYCPNIPLVNLNPDGSSVHYFRDIDGVYAQNINTLTRSASYENVDNIPKSTINFLKSL